MFLISMVNVDIPATVLNKDNNNHNFTYKKKKSTLTWLKTFISKYVDVGVCLAVLPFVPE